MADYKKTIDFIKSVYGNKDFIPLAVPVFLGNVTGGAAFVGASYLYAYRHLLKEDYCI